VKSNGSFLAASISPNPLNPAAKLSFATTKPGAVKVQMFDVNGRLLRTIAEELNAAAGYFTTRTLEALRPSCVTAARPPGAEAPGEPPPPFT